MYVDIIGYAAGAFTALCFLPQVVQTIRTKRAEDVSLLMLMLTLASVVLYEIYAFLLGLLPVVVMNGIFLALVLLELWLKVSYSRRLPQEGEI